LLSAVYPGCHSTHTMRNEQPSPTLWVGISKLLSVPIIAGGGNVTCRRLRRDRRAGWRRAL